MESIEMVKCLLANGPADQGTVRYVPLEIYRLWRFLMERVHHFRIVSPVVSRWIADASLGAMKSSGMEAVVEVRFLYQDSPNAVRPIVRYFPEQNFDEIYGYFREHFQKERVMEDVRRRLGFFLAREAKPYHQEAEQDPTV
jgi:hypothetical protein